MDYMELYVRQIYKLRAHPNGYTSCGNLCFFYRYEMGLMKLENSANDVNIMQAELELLQPKLVTSTNEVMDLLRV